MQLHLKQFNNDTLLIFYKLLHDSLFMALIFFTLTLIAEAVLPGIIISHIGFSKIVFALLLNIFFLKLVAKKIPLDCFGESVRKTDKSWKKIILPLVALGALLFYNSQLGMNIFLSSFLLLVCGIIGYLSYQILFD
jgi:hypothetical protein